jgi:diaminobutyrate-2-oxoglutarate transaminase
VQIFAELESEVRGYCRSWPVVFATAKGSSLCSDDGREYLDFFAGAGALNYGHNHPEMKQRLIEYFQADGVIHGLDMFTTAKQTFLERFDEVILRPRDMRYKVQFPGPTGTNAVEAALKLARKVTGRERVVSFTNAFHGMTLGSLAVTGNSMKRQGAGVPLNNAMPLPFDGFLGDEVDSIDYVETYLNEDGSGLDLPAAVILETVQAEGGINVAGDEWLLRLVDLCKRNDIMLIVDDIQVGCGRTGPFFSFEALDIEPDVICLSKSLSGFGLPMALTLIKPEFDVWDPGEHNGTFRGNNAAFVTATAALDLYWRSDDLSRAVDRKSERVAEGLDELLAKHSGLFAEAKGKGLIQGLRTTAPELGAEICDAAFRRGLLVETAGPGGEVVKLLPPLVVEDDEIDRALEILDAAADDVVENMSEELLAASEAEAEEVPR